MKTEFKKWLKEKAMTTEGFARATGFHVATVSKWVSMNRQPRELYQDHIAQVFPDCPIGKKLEFPKP